MPGDESTGTCSGRFAIQPPSNFNFERTSEWPAWSQEFDDYRFASGLNERSEEAQVRTLLYTMGRQARTIFQTFNLSEDDAKKYEVVKGKFDKHFVAARNIVYESACFHRRSQNPGESVDNFVTVLHTLADRCDFGTFKERMTRDRFVVGLRDAKLSETLQMDADLTLASAVVKARLKETVHEQQHQLRNNASSSVTTMETDVDAVEKKSASSHPLQKEHQTHRVGGAAPEDQRCPYCGQASHPRPMCPAKAAKCYHCSVKGHFSAVCRKKGCTTSKSTWRAAFLYP
ncbi:uncharacterized protein LOC125759175 [Rhipicephalus sanguineus]|uniref:uncharacterized protein LOC125759175 n=1 Tax=Rhipicephalus sanguineus TaxID=34632 RepID=UPI0020C58D03|nr:uncharacterized protein LOC125759175 [Rhipicephalus sanguineus]